VAVQFARKSLNSTDDSSSSQVFAEALVRENKGRVSAGPLAMLTKEKSREQSRHTGLGSLLKYIQKAPNATRTTMLFYLADSGRPPVPVPCGQSNFLQDAKEVL
jgi:hypothetical protein